MADVLPRAALDGLRGLVTNAMADTCVIVREEQGIGTYDPGTKVHSVATSTVYSGPCSLGDRIEGAWASGGFGGNPQEWAHDSRAHSAVIRLPHGVAGADSVEVGDIATINAETWRITAKERATHIVSHFYRANRYDPEKSYS